MTQEDQAQRFGTELHKLVVKYGTEYDLMTCAIIGILEAEAHLIKTDFNQPCRFPENN